MPFTQRFPNRDREMKRKASLAAMLAVCSFGVSSVPAVPVPEPQDNLPPGPKATRTVIVGTWAWNIEANRLGASERCDLSWTHQTAVDRYLQAINGAAIKVVPEPFEKINLNYLKTVEFAKDKIPASDNNNLLK